MSIIANASSNSNNWTLLIIVMSIWLNAFNSVFTSRTLAPRGSCLAWRHMINRSHQTLRIAQPIYKRQPTRRVDHSLIICIEKVTVLSISFGWQASRRRRVIGKCHWCQQSRICTANLYTASMVKYLYTSWDIKWQQKEPPKVKKHVSFKTGASRTRIMFYSHSLLMPNLKLRKHSVK